MAFRFDGVEEIGGEFEFSRDGQKDLTVLGFPDQNQFQALTSPCGVFESSCGRRLALLNALDVALSVAVVVAFAPAVL